MDIFATGMAIDLYRIEMNRRIEEKDKTIKKHKDRELTYVAMFLTGLFSLMIAAYLTINNALCLNL